MRPHWRDVVFVLVFVAPPSLKRVLLRRLCGAEVAPSAHVGWFASVGARRIVLRERSRVGALTLIRCADEVTIGRYAEVSSFVLAYGAGSFQLGDHSYVGPQCLINADEPVRIGARSALGPRSMVFTHGSFLPYTEGYPVRLAPVTVGDRTWIAAGVFLHPGISVGDDVFVNACSVVTQDIPPGRIAEGAPARDLWGIERFRRPMTAARVDAAVRHLLSSFAELALRRGLGATVDEERDLLRVRYRGDEVLVCYVPSTGDLPARAPSRPCRIVILNGAAKNGVAAARGDVLVDLGSMRTPLPHDAIHAELVGFMRRYYGLKLEFEDRR
jgi:acetyltransferase-like isoleucine patch superfamily enzyme